MKAAVSFLSAAFGLASLVSAQAADLPIKAPAYKAPPLPASYNWQGFYIGGHAGYIWSRTDVFDNGVLIESDARTDGFVGGLLAGYNWSVGNIVFGLEGDFGWSNAHGTGIAVVSNPNRYDIDWTGHVRGRIGIVPTSSPLLLFVAGGAAFSRFEFKDGETGDKTAATYTGASVGVGVDYAVANQILIRAEWLHDFYSMSSSLLRIHDYTAKLQNTDTARGAIIFKFN